MESFDGLRYSVFDRLLIMSIEGSSRGGFRRIASLGPRGLYPGKEGKGVDITSLYHDPFAEERFSANDAKEAGCRIEADISFDEAPSPLQR